MGVRFIIYTISRLSINLAAGLYVVTLIWNIQTLSGSTSITAFTYAFLGLSVLIVLPIGPKIDSSKPGAINIFSIIVQLLVVLTLIIIYGQSLFTENLIFIIFLAFVSSVALDIYVPSSNTLFTQIVPDTFYKKGNSIIQTGDQIVNFLSYILVASLIILLGDLTTLVVSLILFVIGLGLKLYIVSTVKLRGMENEERSFTESFKIGFGIIKNHDILKYTIPIAIFTNIVVAVIVSLLPSIAQENGIVFYASMYVSFFIGFIVGAIISNKLDENLKNLYILGLLIGITLLVFSLFINSLFALIFIMIFGVLSGIINIFDDTIFQNNTPKNEMGNVLTMKIVILSLATPVGASLSGILALTFENQTIIFMAAVTKITFDLLFLFLFKSKIFVTPIKE